MDTRFDEAMEELLRAGLIERKADGKVSLTERGKKRGVFLDEIKPSEC
jgi:Mn-dependent DtxR family transcriptional regulator